MTNIKLQFAFFWIGDDISIPSALVFSIRYIYGKEAYIYHLSDETTNYIKGTDETLRARLPKEIMLARLQAYTILKSNTPTIFLDADSLIIGKINLPKFEAFKAFVIKRKEEKFIVNHNWPEYYPEFLNKKITAVMPIYFGFIATPNGGKFFEDLLDYAQSLPQRFHRWYGDQIALSDAWRKNEVDYFLLNQDEYLFIVKNKLNKDQLIELINNGTKIVTFKGPESKIHIHETLKELTRII